MTKAFTNKRLSTKIFFIGLFFPLLCLNSAVVWGQCQGGQIGIDQSICVGASPTTFNSVVDGTGNSTYQWEKSTTSSFSGFTTISLNASNKNYTEPNPLTQTTYYRRLNSKGGSKQYSNVVTVTILPLPSVPITIGGSSCGTGTTAVAAAGAGVTEDYKWYDALSGGSLLQTGGALFIIPSISATTTYYVSKYNTVTNCESARVAVFATVHPGMVLTITTRKNVSHPGGNDGEISLLVSGGKSPYTFKISGAAPSTSSSTTHTFYGLQAISYDVEVQDANGCLVNIPATRILP